MLINKITDENYTLDTYRKLSKISFSDHERCLYELIIGNNKILLGVSSDVIEPQILEEPPNVIIGVDQKVFIINKYDLNIKKEIILDYNFYSFEKVKNTIIIICEQQIVMINLIEILEFERINLIDLVEDYRIIDNNILEIKFSSGYKEDIVPCWRERK